MFTLRLIEQRPYSDGGPAAVGSSHAALLVIGAGAAADRWLSNERRRGTTP